MPVTPLRELVQVLRLRADRHAASCWSILAKNIASTPTNLAVDHISAPVAETVDRSQLNLLTLCFLVKPKEGGDKHGDCHRRGEHQDQHGTVLLSLQRTCIGLVSVFTRRPLVTSALRGRN
jgi:hypothetical protein